MTENNRLGLQLTNLETGEGIYTLTSPNVAGGEVVAAVYQGPTPNESTWTEYWLYRVGVYMEPSCAGPQDYTFTCVVDSPMLPPTPPTASLVAWMRERYPEWATGPVRCDTHVVVREEF